MLELENRIAELEKQLAKSEEKRRKQGEQIRAGYEEQWRMISESEREAQLRGAYLFVSHIIGLNGQEVDGEKLPELKDLTEPDELLGYCDSFAKAMGVSEEEQRVLVYSLVELVMNSQETDFQIHHSAAIQHFVDSGAENYTTHSYESSDGEHYSVTVQRIEGKSPATEIAELRERVAELEKELAGD